MHRHLYTTALAVLLPALSLSGTSAHAKKSSGAPLYISVAAPPVTPQKTVTAQKTSANSSTSGFSNSAYQTGLSFKAKGDANRALIEFLQASKENPKFTAAYYEQALLFREKGHTKLAESALTQALTIDPNYQQARLLLAAIRLESGNVGGATQELSKSLGLELKNKAPGINLNFAPDSSAKAAPAAVSVPAVKDDWTQRLTYLNLHGTNTLKPGEAFMFSEETGEALLILADGQKIRRVIASPRRNSDLIKEKRPELLLPKEYLYKLSAQGKVLDGANGEEMVRPSAVSDANNRSVEREETGWKDADDDLAGNQILRKANLDDYNDSRHFGADSANAANLEPVRQTPTNTELKLDQADKMAVEDGITSNGGFADEFGVDVIMEKTQKVFGWLKKTLRIP